MGVNLVKKIEWLAKDGVYYTFKFNEIILVSKPYIYSLKKPNGVLFLTPMGMIKVLKQIKSFYIGRF